MKSKRKRVYEGEYLVDYYTFCKKHCKCSKKGDVGKLDDIKSEVSNPLYSVPKGPKKTPCKKTDERDIICVSREEFKRNPRTIPNRQNNKQGRGL